MEKNFLDTFTHFYKYKNTFLSVWLKKNEIFTSPAFINFSNSKSVINSGADILVSGTTIFKENKGNIKKNIKILRSM